MIKGFKLSQTSNKKDPYPYPTRWNRLYESSSQELFTMTKLTHTDSPKKKKKRSHTIDHLNQQLLLEHRNMCFQWKQKNMLLGWVL